MSEATSAVGETNGRVSSSATDLVRRVFDLFEAGDVDAAVQYFAPDVKYINASLPTIRGRERVRQVFTRMFGLPGAGFKVYIHSISQSGDTVLTERTDVLIFGRVRVQLWVCGRFDVVGGQIVLWKDYFDWLNVLVATVRGLLGAVVPALGPKPPAE